MQQHCRQTCGKADAECSLGTTEPGDRQGDDRKRQEYQEARADDSPLRDGLKSVIVPLATDRVAAVDGQCLPGNVGSRRAG